MFGCLVSCGTKVIPPSFDLPAVVNLESVAGKWKADYLNLVAYLDPDLEKIVLSDGCIVVTADYKQVSHVINFANIVKTQPTCNELTYKSDLNQILEQTVSVKHQSKNQVIFLNQLNESLLILNKN